MQFKKTYDPKSEAQWFEYEDARFLVAPMQNPYQRTVMQDLFTIEEALGVDEKGALAFSGVKAKDAIARIYELYSHSLVLDWENVLDGEKEVKFSPKNALEIMKTNPEFANWLVRKANELLVKTLEEKEKVVKN